MKKNKQFSETKFGAFLNKAKDVAPELLQVAGKIATGNVIGAVSEVGNILKKESTKSAEAKVLLNEFKMFEMEFNKECFELEVEDRKDARKLFSNDSLIQKIFAIVFLVGYGVLCWYMLEILKGEANESELFKTMVTMIFTGTSTKLSTIVDFFFGGSVK